MKKAFSIILIFAILSNILEYQLLFLSLQYKIQIEVKLQIRKGLKDEELALIVPNNENDLQWARPAKEFKYKDKMYDVAKIKIVGKKKYYYCIRDEEEFKLIAHFNKVKHSDSNKLKLIKRFSKIHLFYQDICKRASLAESDCKYAEHIYKLKDNYILVPESPPQEVYIL